MKKKTIMGLIAIVAITAAVIFAGCIEETPIYPWKSILIWEGRAPAGISGNVLEVNVDLGRQLSSNEFKSLSEKVKLIDENGREYRPFGRISSERATHSFLDSEGQVWVSWHADFAYGFVFAVQSRSSNYTLSWCDYPPLAVGNPFQSPFCLGCVEEETPASTPTTIVTPTPTLTATPVSPTAKASATLTRANVGESISFSGADSTDPDGTITSYEWDFDEGTTTSGATVTHAYSNAGIYTVTLTVTDNDGLSGTDTIEITITILRYTLSEAIGKNFVKAEITGSGASSGDCINLKLTWLTSYTSEIRVPKGTVLLASGTAQNMVVYKVRGIPKDTMWITPVSKIVLDSSELQTFILEAYCLDFHKENPSSSTKFSVGTLTDPQILKILDALDNLSSNITSVGAIQTAIWVVTEDVSKKELVDRFPVEQKDIDNAKLILEEAGIDATSKRVFR
jgi:PKD repeat protein